MSGPLGPSQTSHQKAGNVFDWDSIHFPQEHLRPLNFAGIPVVANTDAQLQRLLEKGVFAEDEGRTGGRSSSYKLCEGK